MSTQYLAPGTVDRIMASNDYETTLAAVRELSEKATLRPSPFKLRCVPWSEFTCHPVNAFQKRMDRKLEIRLLLDEIART
jgi:hypothetical protein